MTETFTVTLPGVPDIALRKNRGNTTHWDRYRAAKAQRETAYLLAREVLLPMATALPWEQAKVTITQFYCGRPLDAEGLSSGCGPALDGLLLDTGLLVDDRPDKYLVGYYMTWERVPHRADARVDITVARVS